MKAVRLLRVLYQLQSLESTICGSLVASASLPPARTTTGRDLHFGTKAEMFSSEILPEIAIKYNIM
jgi:hypothetical protein